MKRALLLVLLTISTPALAQTSHMGQKITEHVVVRGSAQGTFFTCKFFFVLPDGTHQGEDQTYVVPRNRLLVITDVEWRAYRHNNPFHAGDVVSLKIVLNGAAVFRSRTITVDHATSMVGTSEQLTTGFVVAPVTQMCAMLEEQGMSALLIAESVILRGYLIDAP